MSLLGQFEFYEALLVGIAFLFFLAIALFVIGIIRSRSRKNYPFAESAELRIDLQQLGAGGPETCRFPMEVYSTPVRLAVLVVAPKGQGMELPNDEQLRVLIDRIATGMNLVLDDHHPIIHHWPHQLSEEGFSHAFFHNVELPGDEGRGTPWCEVVGHFTAGMGTILLGMACLGDSPNQLGQITIEHEGQWRDVIRVPQAQ